MGGMGVFRVMRCIACLLVILIAPTALAREFDCTATVNYRQLEGSGFEFLEDLKELVEDYYNNNNWTDDTFESEELIECSLQIIFQQAITLTSFRAQLVLTSRRPIYGTTAKTTVLQISDNNWDFSFAQGSPLVFEIERFDPLTSVLDYYAYVMLGYDYDSFSEMGGEELFQQAKRIQQLGAATNLAGWSTLDRDGRSQIIDQLTAPQLKPLRTAYFKYHFEGLDHFTTDQDGARAAVLEVLDIMRTLYEDLSSQYVFDIFFSTKYRELVGLFADSELSSQAYDTLANVDPGNLTSYSELVE